ncbi:hypothetical protein L198_07699 [Cryptococcus wingfieldii CBS 7118]|uniref:Transmembrane protein n=1 Tax=Cryptococcus wingfieldii CBS 7118 TaxID=1295528 RepID=A0A1E3I1V2_9TREE|nr:hypothetical protein L198_07699 [Cryptococcus wingfieldii CBS 7118]ODN82477.1 hypothetical protein L198_07699 [Cryptococcus wingfieldii CBS 7118]
MASILLGEPNTLPTDPIVPGTGSEKKKRQIPQVAFYVAGSAFVMTIGLTAMVIPYVRQAARSINRPEFMSNRHMPILASRKYPSPLLPPSASAPGANSSSTSASAPLGGKAKTSALPAYSHPTFAAEMPISEKDILREQVAKSRLFNAREEKSLFGGSLMLQKKDGSALREGEEEGEAGEGGEGGKEGDNMEGALLGAKAFGIATGIVFGCAGLGMWIVGKAVGAEDPEDFAVKMRQQLVTSMPALVTSVNKPGRSVDGFDGQAIEEWVEGLEREDERPT